MAIIGAVIVTMSWWGALTGFIWGGLVRIFFVHHVTWSINSVCHLWGTRPYKSNDESRNNPVFGILALLSRGSGGIGRRASLRGWWGQPRGGSSPLRRTTSRSTLEVQPR